MTEQRIKNHSGLKWILLFVCLATNAQVIHYLNSNEANLIFSKGPEHINTHAFSFSALFAVFTLILAIHLSLKDFTNSSKINFGILILILINLPLTGFNVFISLVGLIFSTPSGF